MPESVTSYVAPTTDNQLRPALYGPYPTDLAARGAGVTIGFTDPDIVATTVLPLATPGFTDVTAVLADTGREAPGPVLAHLDPAPVAGDQPVVILLADRAGQRLAAVGLFPSTPCAYRWRAAATGTAGVALHLVGLAPGPQPHPDDHPDPHTITIAGPHGVGFYGPFPDGLHATAWAHQHTAGLDPHRHTVTLQPVSAPFDLTGRAAPYTPPRPPAPGCAIVVLADNSASGAVGFFADTAAAHAWADSQRPAITDATFTVLPVTDPTSYHPGR